MTTHHRQRGIAMARCAKCDHDLIVKPGSIKDGAVYCSNTSCGHTHRGHPTKAVENRGKAAAA